MILVREQEVVNVISIAALRACGRLAGLYQQAPPTDDATTNGVADEVTPENPVLNNSLQSLLTPYIVGQIPVKSPQQVIEQLFDLNLGCLFSFILSDYDAVCDMSCNNVYAYRS